MFLLNFLLFLLIMFSIVFGLFTLIFVAMCSIAYDVPDFYRWFQYKYGLYVNGILNYTANVKTLIKHFDTIDDITITDNSVIIDGGRYRVELYVGHQIYEIYKDGKKVHLGLTGDECKLLAAYLRSRAKKVEKTPSQTITDFIKE